MLKIFSGLKNFFSRSESIRSPNFWMNTIPDQIGISADSALKVAAYYAGNKILSDVIGTLPLKFYERSPDGGREEYQNYFLAKVFKKPNILQTRSEFFGTLVSQTNLRGAYYAGINYKNGYITELLPMNPLRMIPKIENNKLLYKYQHVDKPTKIYKPDRIFHYKNLSLDGLNGLTPIRYAAKTLNLSLESEDHGYRYFKNGARTSGWLKHPAQLSLKAQENLEKSIHKKTTGDDKFKIRILEEGMEWIQGGLTNEDSQYLQTREFEVRDVARWLNVPLELLHEPAKTGVYSNREEFMQSFVTFSLLSWVVKIEEKINIELIPEEDQEKIFSEFLLDGLLRSDILKRYRAYISGKQWGVLSTDEIRKKENMNPLPDGSGKKYYMPLNMADIDEPQMGNGGDNNAGE